MEPKRYIGSDVNRLFARIRREVGPDAIILRTRSLLREDAEPLVEILAAPSDGASGLPPAIERTMVRSVLARLDPSVTVGDIEDMLVREALPSEDFTHAAPATFTVPPATPAATPARIREDELLDQIAAELERRASEVTPTAAAPARPTTARGDTRSSMAAAGFSTLAIETVAGAAPGAQDAVQAVAGALERGALAYPDEDQTAILTVQGARGSGRTVALLRMALDCARAGRPALLVAMTDEVADVTAIRAFARHAGVKVESGRDWQSVGRLARRAEPGTCFFLDVPAGPWRMPLPVGTRHYRYLSVPATLNPRDLAGLYHGFDLRPFSGAVLTFGDRARTLQPSLDFVLCHGLGVAFVSDGADPSSGIAVADPLMLASGSFTTATGEGTDVRAAAIA